MLGDLYFDQKWTFTYLGYDWFTNEILDEIKANTEYSAGIDINALTRVTSL